MNKMLRAELLTVKNFIGQSDAPSITPPAVEPLDIDLLVVEPEVAATDGRNERQFFEILFLARLQADRISRLRIGHCDAVEASITSNLG